MSAGLWQFLPDGGMSKFLHTGAAAGNGILVAMLAKNGFSGATHILEGKQGFFAGYARQEVCYDLFKGLRRKMACRADFLQALSVLPAHPFCD